MRNLIGITAVVAMLGACGGAEPEGEAAAPTPMPASVTFTAEQIEHGGVKWAAVTLAAAGSAITVPGELQPNEDLTARLGAPAGGRVIDVHVRPGDRVEAGHLLVTLQSAEAGRAQSDLATATAAVTSQRAQSEYAMSARARAERLLVLKAIPRQDYERAIADEEQARAALTQAEAELRRARSTAEQLGATESASGEIALRAPRAGVVLERMAVPGTVVEAGAPLVVVTDPTSLWLTIDAPEQFGSLFHVGDRLTFTVPAYPGEQFAARVDAVSPGYDAATRTLAVRAFVTSGGKLKSEMLASVAVSGGAERVASVPEDAVQLVEGLPTVFIAMPDGTGGSMFHRRVVEVGARSGGRIAVTRGLGAGEIVVTAGSFAVKAEFQRSTMSKMEM